MRTSAAPRASLGFALAALAAVAVPLSLGAWQLRRAEWKEALIARITARAHEEPSALPAPQGFAQLSPEDYEYRRVRAVGRFDLGREALVFSQPPPGASPEPGYHVLTPFHPAAGGVILVDRGFIALSKAASEARRHEPSGEVAITGLLRAPERRNLFTPHDNPERGAWFTRDPVKIAAFFHIADAAPLWLQVEPGGVAASDMPRPDAAELDLPNNHLSYALTWFILAFALAAGCLFYARARPR